MSEFNRKNAFMQKEPDPPENLIGITLLILGTMALAAYTIWRNLR